MLAFPTMFRSAWRPSLLGPAPARISCPQSPAWTRRRQQGSWLGMAPLQLSWDYIQEEHRRKKCHDPDSTWLVIPGATIFFCCPENCKSVELSYLPFLFSRNLWSEFLLAIGMSVSKTQNTSVTDKVSWKIYTGILLSNAPSTRGGPHVYLWVFSWIPKFFGKKFYTYSICYVYVS